MIVDYHLHLRSPDGRLAHSVEAAERFAARAVERGVDEIGFSEHVYYFVQTRNFWRLPALTERCRFDLDLYVDALIEAKRQGLPVKVGLEVDWVGERSGELAEILAEYPFDFLLGSVHWLAPDLAKIHGVQGSDDRYEELAAAVDAGGVALEISTAGLRKPVGEFYPDARLVQRSTAPITLASDAHDPALVGEDFDHAVVFAREHGRESVCVFEGRLRRQEPLG